MLKNVCVLGNIRVRECVCWIMCVLENVCVRECVC